MVLAAGAACGGPVSFLPASALNIHTHTHTSFTHSYPHTSFTQPAPYTSPSHTHSLTNRSHTPIFPHLFHILNPSHIFHTQPLTHLSHSTPLTSISHNSLNMLYTHPFHSKCTLYTVFHTLHIISTPTQILHPFPALTHFLHTLHSVFFRRNIRFSVLVTML